MSPLSETKRAYMEQLTSYLNQMKNDTFVFKELYSSGEKMVLKFASKWML